MSLQYEESVCRGRPCSAAVTHGETHTHKKEKHGAIKRLRCSWHQFSLTSRRSMPWVIMQLHPSRGMQWKRTPRVMRQTGSGWRLIELQLLQVWSCSVGGGFRSAGKGVVHCFLFWPYLEFRFLFCNVGLSTHLKKIFWEFSQVVISYRYTVLKTQTFSCSFQWSKLTDKNKVSLAAFQCHLHKIL